MMHNQFTKDHKENKYCADAEKFHRVIEDLISNMIMYDKLDDYVEILRKHRVSIYNVLRYLVKR